MLVKVATGNLKTLTNTGGLWAIGVVLVDADLVITFVALIAVRFLILVLFSEKQIQEV